MTQIEQIKSEFWNKFVVIVGTNIEYDHNYEQFIEDIDHLEVWNFIEQKLNEVAKESVEGFAKFISDNYGYLNSNYSDNYLSKEYAKEYLSSLEKGKL